MNGAEEEIILNMIDHALDLIVRPMKQAVTVQRNVLSLLLQHQLVHILPSCSRHLLMPKSEPLLSQEQKISCDAFAKFLADKISQIQSELDAGGNMDQAEEMCNPPCWK